MAKYIEVLKLLICIKHNAIYFLCIHLQGSEQFFYQATLINKNLCSCKNNVCATVQSFWPTNILKITYKNDNMEKTSDTTMLKPSSIYVYRLKARNRWVISGESLHELVWWTQIIEFWVFGYFLIILTWILCYMFSNIDFIGMGWFLCTLSSHVLFCFLFCCFLFYDLTIFWGVRNTGKC